MYLKTKKYQLKIAAVTWILAMVAMATLVVAQADTQETIPQVLAQNFSPVESFMNSMSNQITFSGEPDPINGPIADAQWEQDWEEEMQAEPEPRYRDYSEKHISEDTQDFALGPETDERLNGHAIQSLEFAKGTTIIDALRMLGATYQKNIVPSPDIQGEITITHIYNVTFEEALQAILGPNKYQVEGNLIRVYTPEEYSALIQLETAFITLHYISAAEASNLIVPLLSDFGTIATTSASKQDTMPGNSGDATSIRDRLVIRDYKENINHILELIENIDIRPPQILIEVTMLEAKLDETTEFGIDFDTLDASVTGIGQEGISQAGFASGVTSGGLSIGLVQDHVRIFIRALESITDTTVLANPKILALNKQAGMLHIGENIGYLTTTQVNADGATQSVEFLEVGTVLRFRPYICEDGYIRMEINPEQSEGDTETKGDFVLPRKTLTRVMTNVMVKDGMTIALGGLFREKTDLSRSQVPIAGDLPLIGEAFRKTNDQSIRTELIILLTPHIINDPEQARGEDRLRDIRQLNHNARQNLTWLSRAKRAEDRYAKAVELYSKGRLEEALAEINGILETQRNYFEPIRLREKIIQELDNRNIDNMERIMINVLREEQSKKWMRQ